MTIASRLASEFAGLFRTGQQIAHTLELIGQDYIHKGNGYRCEFWMPDNSAICVAYGTRRIYTI